MIHLTSQLKVIKSAFHYVDKNLEKTNTLLKEIRIVYCITELQQILKYVFLFG